MTKNKALEILENWINSGSIGSLDGWRELPLFDELVCEYKEPDGTISEWTFKGLIKFAYDLEDKK